MQVGIVAQRENDRARTLARELGEELADDRVAVVIDATTADAITAEGGLPDEPAMTGVGVEAMADCDLVVSIGGDGTFLFAARGAGETPIVGVNLGEVGFLTAVQPDEAVGVVTHLVGRLRRGETVPTRTSPRLECAASDWTLGPALNDVAVYGPRRGRGGGAHVSVAVDGHDYAAGRADGVLVSTPTGSTAYNLSEGGPLVHPDAGGIVVTLMAAEPGQPPLVVDLDSEVRVEVTDAERGAAVADGRVRHRLDPPSTLTLSRAERPVRVAGPERDFFEGLAKLD